MWVLTTVAMSTGFTFICSVLHGAIQTLDAAHYTKYAAYDPTYLEFKNRTTLWGPKWWQRQWHGSRLVEDVQGLSSLDNTSTNDSKASE
jgi:hypothetical protein